MAAHLLNYEGSEPKAVFVQDLGSYYDNLIRLRNAFLAVCMAGIKNL